jgi:putative membrane protein
VRPDDDLDLEDDDLDLDVDEPPAAAPPAEDGLDLDDDPLTQPLPGPVAPRPPPARRAPKHAAVAPADAPWLKLHPLSLLANLLPQMMVLFQQVGWPLVLLALAGGSLDAGFAVNGGLLLTFVLIAVSRTALHSLTLRYRLVESRLEIRSGVLNRTRRAVELQRVQNVEVVRNLFHRAFGLAEVRIETASGEEVEGLLSALSIGEATRLADALRVARRHEAPAQGEGEPVLAENSVVDLLRYGATSTELGGTAVVLGILLEFGLATDPEHAADTTRQLGGVGLGMLVLAAGIGTWLFGLVRAIVRHHGFRVTRGLGVLTVEEGLFTRRRVDLPLSKIQRLVVQETWLRRVFGLTTVVIETAAARAGERGVTRAQATIPVVEGAHLGSVLGPLLPGVPLSPHADPLGVALRPPPPIAGRRAIRTGLLRGVVLAALAAALLDGWPGWSGVVLLPGSVLVAWLDHRSQGWFVDPSVLVARRGWLRRVTTVVARSKIQSVDVDQGPLARRFGLGEIVLRVAGGEVVMPPMLWADAWALGSDLSGDLGRPARRAA